MTISGIIGSDGNRGFVNLDGRVAVEPIWDTVWNFDSEGMAKVVRDGKDGMGRYGWINNLGEIIVQPVWAQCSDYGPSGLAKITNEDKQVGIVDRRGKVVVPAEYDKCASEVNTHGLFKVTRDGKTGWVNDEGEIALNLDWDDAFEFDAEGMAAVKRNSNWGWINLSGDVVIEPKWGFVTADVRWTIFSGNLSG